MKRNLLSSLGCLSLIASLGLVGAAPVFAQNVPELEAFNVLAHMVRWSGLLASLAVIAAAWLLLRFETNLVRSLGDAFAEKRLTFQKLSTFFHFGVYLVTVVAVILLSFEISREVMAIIGGTAAVAIGFSLKDLVASIVAGVMIMFDRPFQVGDRVSFGGQYGDITYIGIRTVRLQTLDDNTVTIPNNMFLINLTSSGNYGALDMQVVMDFHIGVDQNVHRAQELVQEACASSQYVYLQKPIVVRVSQVITQNYFATRLRLKAYVLDTKYEKTLETDVTLRVLEAFQENGIQPPAILHRSASELEATERHTLRVARQNS